MPPLLSLDLSYVIGCISVIVRDGFNLGVLYIFRICTRVIRVGFVRFKHRSQIRFAFRHGHGLVRQDAKTQLRALA